MDAPDGADGRARYYSADKPESRTPFWTSLSAGLEGGSFRESEECSSAVAGLVPTTSRITSEATSSQMVTLRAGKIRRSTNTSTKAASAGGGTSPTGGSL